MSDDMRVLKDHHRKTIERETLRARKNARRARITYERPYGYRLPKRVQVLKKLQEVERLAALIYKHGLESDERQLLRRAATLLDDVSR